MTPGQFLLKYYHTPVNRLKDCLREGGPFEQRRTEAGRRDMETAAHTLPDLPSRADSPLEVHLLTGRRFWYQTAFCLWSLARQSGRTLSPVIYDDGSLSEAYREPLQRLFPSARFVLQSEIIVHLNSHLPLARFPVLRERWQNYPNIRKLTEPHVGRVGWKLVLDSDLLFFRVPSLLLNWADRPDRPLHAVDCESSYGYSRPLMNQLAGAPVADLVNVGLTGLDGTSIDWEKLEYWCRTLIETEGTSYYLEQALIAMLVAGRNCTVAPAADYVTLPQPPEVELCQATMHHYVAHSKRWYFQKNWRRVLAT